MFDFHLYTLQQRQTLVGSIRGSDLGWAGMAREFFTFSGSGPLSKNVVRSSVNK